MSCYYGHDDTYEDAAEDLAGSPDRVENEFGSEEAGEAFEPLSSIVNRLVGRLVADGE